MQSEVFVNCINISLVNLAEYVKEGALASYGYLDRYHRAKTLSSNSKNRLSSNSKSKLLDTSSSAEHISESL